MGAIDKQAQESEDLTNRIEARSKYDASQDKGSGPKDSQLPAPKGQDELELEALTKETKASYIKTKGK